MAGQVNPVEKILGAPLPVEGGEAVLRDVRYVMSGGVLRQKRLVKPVQQDMADFYDRHWSFPGAYDNEASDEFQLALFRTMFPGFEPMLEREVRSGANVLDVGCGSGVAGRAFFGKVFDRINYVGADMSSAIEQAREDYRRLNINVGLVQAELNTLPSAGSFDFVFCSRRAALYDRHERGDRQPDKTAQAGRPLRELDLQAETDPASHRCLYPLGDLSDEPGRRLRSG